MHKSIFVSSTFRDFQRERDLLQTKAEVRTNELLQHLKVSFLDLRWGIDTSEEANLEKVVSICISEVLQSHPFYVIMLGDTYGSCVDPTVARSLYALNGMEYDGKEKSVTEIEIEATGLFRGNRDYVLVLNRQTSQTPDPRAAMLKEKVLSAADPKNIFSYQAVVQKETLFPEDENALITFISNRIYEFLKDQAPPTESFSVSFATEQAKGFYGRQATRQALYEAICNHTDPVFRVYGPAGSGVTAILSSLFLKLREEGEQAGFLMPTYDLPIPFSGVLSELSDQFDIPFRSRGSFFEGLDPQRPYYCFLDELEEIHRDPMFRDLLRRGCIPHNLRLILAVRDPEDAHFILDYPEKEDALTLFDSTLKAYHKEIPRSFRLYFEDHIPQEMIRQPALLQHFLSSLCYLTEEDYRMLGQRGNFMEALSELFRQKLEQFPQKEEDYIRSALQNAPEAQLWLLGLMSVAGTALEERLLLGTVQRGGIACSVLDFRTVKELFRNSIHCSPNRTYSLPRSSFRKAVRNCFTPEQLQWLRYLLVAYMGQNPVILTLPQSFPVVAYQYLALEDYALLSRLLEINSIMAEHGRENGILFSQMCGDFGGDEPGEVYRALAREKNPYCNRWLLQYAMGYVTDLYRQRGTDLFLEMYNTVVKDGSTPEYAADLLGLYAHGMALQFRGGKAQQFTVEEMEKKHIKHFTPDLLIQSYLTYCLSFDTSSAAEWIEYVLQDSDHSGTVKAELLEAFLRITVLMDGNALSYKPQVELLLHRCEEQLLEKAPENPLSMTLPVLYISEWLGIPLQNRQMLIEMGHRGNTVDLPLSTHLLYYHREAALTEDMTPRQKLVDLVCITLEESVPLSTVDLFYVARYFRKICYETPETLSASKAVSYAADLFHRFWDIGGGLYTHMQTVEMFYLGALVCVYDGVKAGKELLQPMLDDSRISTKDLIMELGYFREDAQELLRKLPSGNARLDRLKAILENRN